MDTQYTSHYNWLDKNFWKFLENLDHGNLRNWNGGIITAHGDKCYGYRLVWKRNHIPFAHGVALYLLTYMKPWSDEVRESDEGWVDPSSWVITNYKKFIDKLPECQLPTYYFHWLDNKVERIQMDLGDGVASAFSQLGYSAGAMSALDYFDCKYETID